MKQKPAKIRGGQYATELDKRNLKIFEIETKEAVSRGSIRSMLKAIRVNRLIDGVCGSSKYLFVNGRSGLNNRSHKLAGLPQCLLCDDSCRGVLQVGRAPQSGLASTFAWQVVYHRFVLRKALRANGHQFQEEMLMKYANLMMSIEGSFT